MSAANNETPVATRSRNGSDVCATALFAGLVGSLIFASCSRENSTNASRQQLSVQDIDSRTVEPFAEAGVKALVLVFVSNDCPISNRSAPELRRLAAEYESRGVRFWMVHPTADESVEAIRAHDREYQLPGSSVRDADLKLVERTGATVTPEAAVVLASGTLAYRGRIDDRFVALGQERPGATTRDLANVLAAIAAGHAVSPTHTTAVGCHIPGATLR